MKEIRNSLEEKMEGQIAIGFEHGVDLCKEVVLKNLDNESFTKVLDQAIIDNSSIQLIKTNSNSYSKIYEVHLSVGSKLGDSIDVVNLNNIDDIPELIKKINYDFKYELAETKVIPNDYFIENLVHHNIEEIKTAKEISAFISNLQVKEKEETTIINEEEVR
jgi:hypothetical protein